jgi:hypothetical protein
MITFDGLFVGRLGLGWSKPIEALGLPGIELLAIAGRSAPRAHSSPSNLNCFGQKLSNVPRTGFVMWRVLLKDIELMSKDQDFNFQLARLEAVARHPDEEKGNCDHGWSF